MPGRRERSDDARPVFRPYAAADVAACLAIFDANCPDYFAPNERAEFAAFLAGNPVGYELCLLSDTPVGAFGLTAHDGVGTLNWILIAPSVQGAGVGSAIMRRVLERGRYLDLNRINIAASHKSRGFFARFGARTLTTQEDGWGPGMHRVDMELPMLPDTLRPH